MPSLGLRDVHLPRLRCPTPSALHPDYALVAESTIRWAERFDLLADPTMRERLVRTDCARLGAAVYHDGYSRDALALVTDHMTWLNVHDDLWIDGASRDPDQLDADHARLLRVVRGLDPSPTDHALVHALHDLRTRLLRLSTNVDELDRRVTQYLTTKSWERRRHASRAIPSVDVYVRFRALGGAVYTCFETGILSRPIALTRALRGHAYVETLGALANDLVCWSNDIVSLERELEEGCTTNLVIALRHARGGDWEDALGEAIRRWNEAMETFTSVAGELAGLHGLTSAERDALRDLVALMQAWIRGNLDHCASATVGRWDASPSATAS